MDYFFTNLVVIFHLSCFVSTISIIWFYTDTFLYYSQLFEIFESDRLQYVSYVSKNPDKYFPDFLHEKGLRAENKFAKFLYKLISCPFCLIFWLSVGSSLICNNLLLIAPTYVISLFINLQIKKLI